MLKNKNINDQFHVHVVLVSDAKKTINSLIIILTSEY